PHTWCDFFYLPLQLFVLEGGNLTGSIPWQFEVARFLAPVLPIWAIIKTLLLLFQKQIKFFRLRFIRNHIILIGFGTKGKYLLNQFISKKLRIVVINTDYMNPPAIEYPLSRKTIIVDGEAQDCMFLKKTRINKAKYIISVLENDNIQMKIATNIWQIVKEQRRRSIKKKLICAFHFNDPNYVDLLDHHRMIANLSNNYELRLFSTIDNSVRDLMKNYPFDRKYISQNSIDFVQLILFGFDQIGERIALHSAQKCHFANQIKSKIIVFVPEAESSKEYFLDCYPKFEEICEIEFISIKKNLLPDAKILQKFLVTPGAISTLLFLNDDPIKNIKNAKQIKNLIDGEVSIFIRVKDESILAEMFLEKNEDFLPANFKCFGLPNQTNSIEFIIEEKLDQMAQAIHAEYLEKNPSEAEDNASKRSWSQLSEEYRDANRQAADHIDIKLRAINCKTISVSGKQPPAKMTVEEIEILAKMEHNRWKAERLLKGWTYAPERDDVNKKHPCIVPWEDLPEDERDKDRQQVRDIPNILKKVKLKIVRSN
ncbi:NAD-binding protein, partial [candidate division KSB1 bacterium]|nr:NAD-binding protein [candidate division KSB1 bacterium]